MVGDRIGAGGGGGVKILVVDDHAVVRAGLHQMFASMMGAEVREAADGVAAAAVLEGWRPDVMILDLGLPGQGGLALLPGFAKVGLRVLVVSMHAEPFYATRALEAGALGYVSKNIAPEELLGAVRMVGEGRRFIEPRIAQELALQRIDAGDRLHQLSQRDLEIMRLMAAGRSLSEIAAVFEISYKTVANTVSLIRTKLGVSRTADLIRMAIEMRPEAEGK
jgi:two-component system, NarL family, invasion response regulator UvrY